LTSLMAYANVYSMRKRTRKVPTQFYGIVDRFGNWWSNYLGWTEKKNATWFTYTETIILRLPVGGRWVVYDFKV